MTFAEKLRNARTRLGMSQKELARKANVNIRTITNYESGERVPKKQQTYDDLAFALGVTVESLKDDQSDFVVKAQEQYGRRGSQQAEDVVRAFRVAAAGGELDDDDLDFIKDAMMQTYWDAKEYNRRFANRKRKSDSGSEN